jgi:hypothetical protein
MTNRRSRVQPPKKTVYATRKAGPLQLLTQTYYTKQQQDRLREQKLARRKKVQNSEPVDAGATGLEDLFARTTLAPAPAPANSMNALTAAFGKLGGARTRRKTRRAANSNFELSLAGATIAFALGGLLAGSDLEGGKRHKTRRRR